MEVHSNAYMRLLAVVIFLGYAMFLSYGAGSDKPRRSMLPLMSTNSPSELWDKHPSYAACEIAMVVLAAFIYLMQVRNSKDATLHLLFHMTWMGGSLVEILTAFHPEMDSVWKSQAWLMLLGGRIPLCCLFGYIVLGFVPSVLSSSAGFHNAFTESCLCALLGGFLHAIVCVFGTQQLWWTFHADDPLFADPSLVGPAALQFCATAQVFGCHLAWRLGSRWASQNTTSIFNFISLVFICSTVGYIGIPGILVLLFCSPAYVARVSGYISLNVFRVVCLVVVFWVLLGTKKSKDVRTSWTGRRRTVVLSIVEVVCLLGVVATCAILCRPENVIREGYGQEIGECSTMEPSFFGIFSRSKRLCLEKVVQDLDIFRKCPPRTLYQLSHPFGVPGKPVDWSVLCGTKKTMQQYLWLGAQFVGAIVFVALASGLALRGEEVVPKAEQSRKEEQRSKGSTTSSVPVAKAAAHAPQVSVNARQRTLTPPPSERTQEKRENIQVRSFEGQ